MSKRFGANIPMWWTMFTSSHSSQMSEMTTTFYLINISGRTRLSTAGDTPFPVAAARLSSYLNLAYWLCNLPVPMLLIDWQEVHLGIKFLLMQSAAFMLWSGSLWQKYVVKTFWYWFCYSWRTPVNWTQSCNKSDEPAEDQEFGCRRQDSAGNSESEAVSSSTHH